MATKYVRADDTPLAPDMTPVEAQPTDASSKKKMYMLLGGGAVLLFMFLLMILLALAGGRRQDPSPTPTPPVQDVTPSSIAEEPTIEPTIEVPATLIINGVEMLDFTLSSDGVLPNGDIIIDREIDYQISYSENTGEFTIAILGSNFIKTRSLAENRFLELLDIDRVSACKLTVRIGTPANVVSRYADLWYENLSSCK